MKRFFTNLLLFYIFGIFIFYFVSIPQKLIFTMLLISMLCLYYNIIKSNLNQSILLYFLFILGIFVSSIYNSGNLEKFVGDEVYIKALVVDLDKKNLDLGKYIIQVDEVNSERVPREKSLLTVIGESELKLGTTIYVKSTFKTPMENSNPGLFNYRLYLKGKKIYTTITVEEYKIDKVDASKISFRYKLKEKAIHRVQNLFKPFLNEENNSLITSIILGDTSYLEEENINLYRDMGLSHILAVSGLHIGIISSFLMFLISRIGIKRKTNIILTLVFIWTYAYIIGYPHSILRASILFSFLYLSRIIHRPYDSINILSLAALILLLMNPYSLFSVGFQLSFIASASIILFTDKIAILFYPLKGKLISTISSLIAVNIGLSPIQAYYFNKLSILGFIANIIIVPILSFSLIIAFMMIGIDFFLASLNMILGKLLNLTLNMQFFLLNIISKSPINLVRMFSPEVIVMVWLFIAIFIIFDMISIRKLPKSIQKTMIIYLLFLLMINILSIKDNMEIHIIDVGQGDSIYIQNGRRNILIDTGGSIFKNNNIPERTVLPYLEKIGVRKLDAIFISHFHQDHCQGLPLLLDEFEVDKVFISHIPDGNYLKLRDERFIMLKKGDIVNIGENIEFEILWPIDDLSYDDNLNNKSMVGVLRYRDTSMIFTGDMESEVENNLLKDIKSTDILKVAHHGSDTSTTKDFLEKIDPKAAIISVGNNNMYNHPSKSVIDRFNDNTAVYRTDQNGLVKIVIEDDFYISPFLIDGNKKEIKIKDYILNNHNYFLYNLLFFVISYIFVKYFKEEELIYDI